MARLMRGRDCARCKSAAFRPRTTDSRPSLPHRSRPLAERPEPPDRPDEVRQADITCLAAQEGWLCLAGAIDACSRKIVGWAADDAMPAALAARAFERTVRQRKPEAGLLHRPDRGSQYASDACLKASAPSRRGGEHEPKSQLFMTTPKWKASKATLKSDLIGERIFSSRAEAKTAIFDYIEVFYNRGRLHSALGFQSPVDFENNLS
jgi:putative transposase